jgi:EAL domain-containing protein (putative c-di-GMP-specific phosphodiesterase class I)/GGDEF domain-containing protein
MSDDARHAHLLHGSRGYLLAVVPALGALAMAMEGALGLLSFALSFPAAVAFCMALGRRPASGSASGRSEDAPALVQRPDLARALDHALLSAPSTGREAAALAIEIDDPSLLVGRLGATKLDELCEALSDRLAGVLRVDDLALWLGGTGFAAVLAPGRRLDAKTALRLAGRVQGALSQPLPLGTTVLHPTVSVGVALSSCLPSPTGEGLLRAASLAAIEALRHGPSAIQTYSEELRTRAEARGGLSAEAADALESGAVQAFFQPQVCARTGELTGLEALARWHHPVQGLIPPAEFLPILEEAGLMRRLGEVMLRDALRALHDWQALGLRVPRVGINLSGPELRDPHLLDRVTWELDRFDLTPDRLVVEVLETVVAAPGEDVVIRNLSGLARLGCGLDLDDFGTGHASITCIRRFSIGRIKIDRSFVTGLDTDPEQQRMMAAILTMADRLGLATLAEGVESAAERDMLAQLGCEHVQGFGIARPMPFAEVAPWIRAREARTTALSARQLRAI